MKTITVDLSKGKKDESPSVQDTLKQVRDLQEELEKNPISNSLYVQDAYLALNHLFNQAAKRAYENQVKQLVNPRKLKVVRTTKLEVFDRVRFFGVVASGERKIFDAAREVANSINELANKGYITGALCRLSIMRLATEPHELDKFIIMSYPCLSPEGYEHVQNSNYTLDFEGANGTMPINLEDI